METVQTVPATDTLPFGILSNATFALFAATVRDEARMHITNVSLSACDPRPGNNIEAPRAMMRDTLRAGTVRQLFRAVDSLRNRYRLEAVDLVDSTRQVQIRVHRSGQLDVDPADQYIAVRDVMRECLQGADD